MSTRLLGLMLVAAIPLATTAAFAVDVRNDDAEPHEMVVSVFKNVDSLETSDSVFDLAPGETRSGACASCIVSLGTDEETESVSASDNQIVTVLKGGLLAVD